MMSGIALDPRFRGDDGGGECRCSDGPHIPHKSLSLPVIFAGAQAEAKIHSPPPQSTADANGFSPSLKARTRMTEVGNVDDQAALR